MTTENRILIEPEDVLGLDLQCGHCGTRIFMPLAKADRYPATCSNCNEQWFMDSKDIKKINDLGQAINQVKALLESKAHQVTIRLEIKHSYERLP